MERVGGRRAEDVAVGERIECWFTAPHKEAADQLSGKLAELGCSLRSAWDFCGLGRRPALPWTVVAEAPASISPLDLANAAESCGAAYHPLGGADRWGAA